MSDLARFRIDAPSEAPTILPPVPEDELRTILAFDQSLRNTGWALLVGVEVVQTGMLKTTEVSKGHLDSLLRAERMYEDVGDLMASLYPRPQVIVHEMPPVALPGRMMRPESSLLAALAIRIAVASIPQVPVVMIGAQQAKRRWTGKGNAKKAEVKVAVLALDPHDTVRTMKPMNEHTIDAIALGWCAAEQPVPV